MTVNTPIQSKKSREQQARQYWTTQMEEGYEFMQLMRKYPIEENGEGMVSMAEVADGLEIEFSATLRNGKFPRSYFIRNGLADSFRKIAKEMNERGWLMKVEDAYRTPEMQRMQCHNPDLFQAILDKTIWELDGKLPTPELYLKRVSAIIAMRPRIGTHVSGSAIDISVLDRDTHKLIERGGGYPEISERTPMNSPFISPEEQENRKIITELFQKHGWYEYPYEFWHYSSGDCYAQHMSGSRQPARYGPILFENNQIRVLTEAEGDQLIESLEYFQTKVEEALTKAGAKTFKI